MATFKTRLSKISKSNGKVILANDYNSSEKNLQKVKSYIDIAEKYKLIPVIDFENYPTIYNDPEYRDSNNAWEYYFHNTSKAFLQIQELK